MALRLRRGTNADRLTVTPAEGELLYTTDSKKIYAGDGSTVGGNIVSGINNLLEDLTPQLGGDLDLNSKSLVGNGNIDITGSITAPSFTGDFYGSVFGDDSELLVDVTNSKIVLSNNILADLSDVQVTGLQPGNVLKWNGNNWYGATDSQVDLSAESLNSLGDVNVDGVQLGQVLAWGGSEWTSSELNLSQLADVNTNNAAQGYSLIFDGVNWQAEQLPLNNIRLNDLANVSAANPNNNDVLSYNSFTNNWVNKSLTLDDITDIDLTGLELGDILSWNGFNWVPGGGFGELRVTDIQGSVYGDDSALIVDARTNTVTADIIIATNTNFGDINCNNLAIDATSEAVRLNMERTETGVLRGTSTFIGAMRFRATDDNETFATAYLLSYVDKISIGHHTTSTATSIDSNGYITISNGNLTLGRGNTTGTERLDVTGNGTFSGFIQVGRFANDPARDAAVTSPGEGMMIFNQSTQKFQGYVLDTGLASGGASNSTPGWVDLN